MRGGFVGEATFWISHKQVKALYQPKTRGKRRRGRREYTTIQIPKTLMEEVNRIIQLGILGYTSRMEFIKDAVRDKILQLQPYIKTKKRKEEKTS